MAWTVLGISDGLLSAYPGDQHLQLFEAGSASNSEAPYSSDADELLRAYSGSGPKE